MTRLLLAVAVVLGGVYPAASQGLIRDAEIEQTLTLLTTPIYKAAGVEPDSINLYIINDKTKNAFVAGGKNIFLNSGLIQKLEATSELQGVIAHELGHITGGHIARRKIKLRDARGPAFLGHIVAIIAGVAGNAQVGSALAAGSQSAVNRDILRHSRSEEAAADQAALTYLDRAGIDPTGLQQVFERFRGQLAFASSKIDPYVVTHPFYSQRIKFVERRVRSAKYRGVAPPMEHVYWHARMRAKFDGFLNQPETVLAQLKHEPQTEFTLYAKTIALHRSAPFQDAMASVEKLNAVRPDDPYYTELKGQILFESGRVEDAVPIFRDAVRLAPDEPLLKAGLGRALLALNTGAADAEALEILQDARRDDMADATALHDLATAYSRAGDDGMASLSTAERFALLGRHNDAILHARRASSVLPEGSPGWFRAQDILRFETEK